MPKRSTPKTINDVIKYGSERDHIVASLQIIYRLLSEAKDAMTRERLGTLAFLISHRYYKSYADLDGIGTQLSEWSKLLTESPEWAEQHIKDLKLMYPEFFSMYEED